MYIGKTVFPAELRVMVWELVVNTSSLATHADLLTVNKQVNAEVSAALLTNYEGPVPQLMIDDDVLEDLIDIQNRFPTSNVHGEELVGSRRHQMIDEAAQTFKSFVSRYQKLDVTISITCKCALRRVLLPGATAPEKTEVVPDKDLGLEARCFKGFLHHSATWFLIHTTPDEDETDEDETDEQETDEQETDEQKTNVTQDASATDASDDSIDTSATFANKVQANIDRVKVQWMWPEGSPFGSMHNYTIDGKTLGCSLAQLVRLGLPAGYMFEELVGIVSMRRGFKERYEQLLLQEIEEQKERGADEDDDEDDEDDDEDEDDEDDEEDQEPDADLIKAEMHEERLVRRWSERIARYKAYEKINSEK